MSMQIESQVISALITEEGNKNSMVLEAILKLDELCFVNEHALYLFLLIKSLMASSSPFSTIYLLNVCDPKHYDFLSDVGSRYITMSSLPVDVDALINAKLHRQIGNSLKKTVYQYEKSESIKQACQLTLENCMKISKLGLGEDTYIATTEDLANEFLSLQPEEKIAVIPTGIYQIDKAQNGGFRNRSLITVAGRSGMGKTTFAMYLAQQIAQNNPKNNILFFSLEMTKQDIYQKQLSLLVGKDINKATKSDQTKAVSLSLQTPMTIYSKPLMSIDYIETSAKIESMKNKVGVIIVDYLSVVQNNKPGFETNVLKQSDIAMRLAALAIELNCIVIALSQVNREYTNRQDKVPITSDAADSSGSERSSTVWLGIYRPEVDEDSPVLKNQFIVKCRKNRFGNIWTASFLFEDGIFTEDFRPINLLQPQSINKIDKYKQRRNELEMDMG